MFNGKHFSGAGKTRLDFVRNKWDAVAVENLLYFLEVVRGRHDDSAFSHDRLCDKRSHVIGRREADHIFNRSGALPPAFLWIVAPLRTISVWRGSEGHAGGVWATALLASHVAGHAERAPTASVETCMEGDEFVFSSMETRQLHRTFNGFGAAVAEKRFGQTARRDVGKLLRQVGDRLHVINVRRAVDEFIHLRLGCRDHVVIAVARSDHRDAREAIEIFATVDVGDGSATGLVDNDGHDRLHEASHYIVFVFLNGV